MILHSIIPFPPELNAAKKQIREQARNYGLDFYPVVFEMCDYETMNQIASYGGFPQRYPHWRFGMEYERLRKQHFYGLGRIYEMVINNDPCYAYLQESNALVDQKLVIAHVYGHADFFKNNLWFSKTNRKMMDEMANHSTHVRKYIEKYGQDVVESWLDVCLVLEDLIDPHSMFMNRGPLEKSPVPAPEPQGPAKFKAKDYMDRYINPPEALEAERKKASANRKPPKVTPARPTRDVLMYLLEHAPMADWQADCLAMIREESYYFAPQGMTKVMNEGWACVVGDSLVATDSGLLPMREIVADRLPARVSDGEQGRDVTDHARFEDRKTIRITTRRGFTLEGSVTHQVLLDDGSWKRMDELTTRDRPRLCGGRNTWAQRPFAIQFTPARRPTLHEVAIEAGVSIDTMLRYRVGRNVEKREQIAAASARYDAALEQLGAMQNNRRAILVPDAVDSRMASFLGYLIGDGHISVTKRVIGLTTADEAQADRFVELASQLFGVNPKKKWDDGRWRISIHSRQLQQLLIELGLTTGISARRKSIPPCILRSPVDVVVAFLRAYFDCDGHAGKQGFILSTASDALAQQTQLLLLNFGILSTRQPQAKRIWNVHVTGQSAKHLLEQIGFRLERKQDALRDYIDRHQWYKAESWHDEIVSIQTGQADVYDVTVADTHRYVAQGFVNHNSYWHSTLMTKHFLEPSEVIDYADHHSGTVHMPPGGFNPYKIGLEIFRDIEERWNKGRFGKDYDESEDLGAKKMWDKGVGLGRQKIFEVRRVYNDVGFIQEFMTDEFIEKNRYYEYGRDPHTKQLKIVSRDPNRIRQQLLYRLTNLGRPFIYVVDGNYKNRGELYLAHKHNGLDIEIKFAVETLRNLHKVWQRPVHLQAKIDDDQILFSFDGEQNRSVKINGETPKAAHEVG
jgi:stage V sporulation protein R